MPSGRPKAKRQLARGRDSRLCSSSCVRAAAQLVRISPGLNSLLTRLI